MNIDYCHHDTKTLNENYLKVIEGSSMYYEWYVKHLQQELQRKDNIINELENFIVIRKARWENEKDYSRWYLENYDNVIQTKHLSHSGVMLESLKSASIKTCEDILDKLKELKEGKE